MYKNAERLLNEKDSLSKSSIRNAVAMARMEASVRKVHSMVHLIQPPTHDEVILPKTTANGTLFEAEISPVSNHNMGCR